MAHSTFDQGFPKQYGSAGAFHMHGIAVSADTALLIRSQGL